MCVTPLFELLRGKKMTREELKKHYCKKIKELKKAANVRERMDIRMQLKSLENSAAEQYGMTASDELRLMYLIIYEREFLGANIEFEYE